MGLVFVGFVIVPTLLSSWLMSPACCLWALVNRPPAVRKLRHRHRPQTGRTRARKLPTRRTPRVRTKQERGDDTLLTLAVSYLILCAVLRISCGCLCPVAQFHLGVRVFLFLFFSNELFS